MLESLNEALTDPASDSIEWVHTGAEIVEGVHVVIEVVTAGGAVSGGAFVEALEGAAAGVAWPVTVGVATVAAEFVMLGLGYSGAAQKIAEEYAANGFAEGLIMGAMKETPDFVKTNFVKWSPVRNVNFEAGGTVAQHYYNASLVLGYRNGYELDPNQTGVLFRDLARAGGPLGDPDSENWSGRDWINFYIAAAMRFRRLHIPEDD